MAERSFDDFDVYAKDYRSIHSQNIKRSGADSFYFAEMKVRLLQPFESNHLLKVLDLGCGDGTTEMYMNKYFPLWHITAIDVSVKSIEEAKSKNGVNCDFVWYDGKTIPSPDESFDVVFMAGVLHHVEPGLQDQMMQQIRRVLKEGGRLYLFEHNPLNPLTRHLVATCVFDAHAKLLKNSAAIKQLRNNHFDVNANRFIIFFPRKGLLSKFIFLEKYLQWLPLGGQYLLVATKSN